MPNGLFSNELRQRLTPVDRSEDWNELKQTLVCSSSSKDAIVKVDVDLNMLSEAIGSLRNAPSATKESVDVCA